MAYQTGSFTSPADLIATIKAFATTSGWTVSGDVVSKGTVFTSLTVQGDYLNTKGGTGESGGTLTGGPGKFAHCLGAKNSLTWSYDGTYYLFALSAPDEIICVMRDAGGLHFNWLAFGSLKKQGSYVGGEYFGASYGDTSFGRKILMNVNNQGAYSHSSSSPETCAPLWAISGGNYRAKSNFFVRCDLSGQVWAGDDGEETNVCHANEVARYVIHRSPNLWNNQSALIPFRACIPRADGKISLIGTFDHARILRIDNYEAGDLITLGSDQYKVFPFFKKDLVNRDGGDFHHSGTFGWAIAYDGP